MMSAFPAGQENVADSCAAAAPESNAARRMQRARRTFIALSYESAERRVRKTFFDGGRPRRGWPRLLCGCLARKFCRGLANGRAAPVRRKRCDKLAVLPFLKRP